MTFVDHYSVVIGRFQTPHLHEGHIRMLHEADLRGKPLIAIGVSPITPSAAQPLPYGARANMVKQHPFLRTDVTTFPLNDHVSDFVWARSLRDKIYALIMPSFIQERSVKVHFMIGKDSAFDCMLDGSPAKAVEFLSYELLAMSERAGYSFAYEQVRIEEEQTFSASELRGSVVTDGPTTSGLAFNEGVIWATQKRFPTAYMCVDIAAVCERRQEILLIQKYEGGPWMLPGGFTEPSTDADDPVRVDAARELYEETGVNVLSDSLEFLGHFRINDWRYRKEADKINTALYKAEFAQIGYFEAGDDAYAANLFSYGIVHGSDPAHIGDIQVAESHKPLITAATGYQFK